MKEKYTMPSMETITLEQADIVTISNETPLVPFGETWTDDVPPIS